MKILLTGANGYIGKRLLPVLLKNGHHVVCCVRDKMRFSIEKYHDENISVVEIDFLIKESLNNIPKDIHVVYYLIHSMESSRKNFDVIEAECAVNFMNYMVNTQVKQVIYLSGIVNDKTLSKHLWSRNNVEEILDGGNFQLTTLRAGIIIGSGSASFEIMRDLVEKLPLMITPKWVHTKSQPIAVRDVISYLEKCLLNEFTYNKNFDIGGSEVLSYREMLLRFANVRGFKRWIIPLPIMSPKISSYWLFFVTSTSFNLASSLIDSLKVEVICEPNGLEYKLGIKPLSFEEAIKAAFIKIEQNIIVSSWKDSIVSGRLDTKLTKYVNVPVMGCYEFVRSISIENEELAKDKIWRIGGDTGWYYGNWLWRLRGFIDKLRGGVGLRRGRTLSDKISTGDTLDFWRVLLADEEKKRLLLFAEMKTPGEAWLELKVEKGKLCLKATFRPKGISGRLYWYALTPLHYFIFNGMLRNMSKNLNPTGS